MVATPQVMMGLVLRSILSASTCLRAASFVVEVLWLASKIIDISALFKLCTAHTGL